MTYATKLELSEALDKVREDVKILDKNWDKLDEKGLVNSDRYQKEFFIMVTGQLEAAAEALNTLMNNTDD